MPGEDFVILDAGDGPDGAWPRMWEGLIIVDEVGYLPV